MRRRRERLETRLRELELLNRGAEIVPVVALGERLLDADDVEDLEEAPDNEVEAAEEEILDQATAARTIAELKAEIGTLQRLESLAQVVRRSGEDRKWRELASVLHEVFSAPRSDSGVAESSPPYGSGPIPKPTPSPHQKLVVFTEHRDTLVYLENRVVHLAGAQGGRGRDPWRDGS